MNNAYANVTAKLATFLVTIFILMAPAAAQTWQSQGKTAVIPVVVENTACNSSTDTVGITVDRTILLSCQSGSWKKQSSSSNDLRGKTTIALAIDDPWDGTANNIRQFKINASGYLEIWGAHSISAPISLFATSTATIDLAAKTYDGMLSLPSPWNGRFKVGPDGVTWLYQWRDYSLNYFYAPKYFFKWQ